MPIYEYRCEACGHTLDALQKISDAPLSDCPACSQSALKRLISAPSFRLKGSGWYETDFKSGKDKKRNLAESVESGSGAKSKDSETTKSGEDKTKKTSDDKPPAKAEKKPAKGSGSEAA
jgi:putative FmdB family regulatory protein